MKTLQRYSVWFGFALLLSPLAQAQSSSPPPLKPNEKIVKTKDGCGMVIDGSARYADHEAKRISELTWSGPCIGGLAMGEGWVSEGEYRYVDFPPTRGWAWYGRRFGVVETRQANGSISFNSFTWDGKSVNYNTLSTAKPIWPGTGVSFPSQVSDTEVYISLSRKPQFDGSNIYAVFWRDPRSDSNVEYKCPNPHSPQGCDALWAEHAGPVIERIKAFIAENKPKADALKREIAPLIAHWRPSPNAKRDDAARHTALRKQHLAERAKREADLARMVRETERLQRENQQFQAEQQAKDEKMKAEAERARAESQRRDEEGWALLRNAAVAAAGGQNSTERKKLALDSLTNESGTSSGSAAYGKPNISSGGATEFIPLPPPGSAKSRNECIKLAWHTSPPPLPKQGPRNAQLPEMYTAAGYGTREVYDRTGIRRLIATTACTEDLIAVVFACIEDRMISSGQNSEASWSAGEHTGTHFSGYDGVNFTTVDRSSNGYIDIDVLSEMDIAANKNHGVRRRAVKVFYGAWLRSEITTAPTLGPFSHVGLLYGDNKYSRDQFQKFTPNGKALTRKYSAANRKANEVLSADKRKWPPDHVSLTGATAGQRIDLWPGKVWRNLGVKDCSAFPAKEIWNATQ